MRDTTQKKEWAAPRIDRLDRADQTEGGTVTAFDEDGHDVSGGMTSYTLTFVVGLQS